MSDLKLNSEIVSFEPGDTILEVAERSGVSIPTLCHLKGEEPFASCMVCVVEDIASGKLQTACSTLARPDMNIRTDTLKVVEQRRCAIELLLSEHLGDCEGPCRLSCPAFLDVPMLIRSVDFGDIRGLDATLREALAFPRIISRVCGAPCEKACRRGRVDESVSIRALVRFVADMALEDSTESKERVEIEKSSSADSSVPVIAIIGAGPVGLACAYHLAAVGFACEVFEGESECWGGLADLAEEVMPRRILDEELEFLKNMGVFVNLNREVDDDAFSEIRREFQAVIVAVGAAEGLTGGSFFGLNTTEQGIYVDSADFATSAENVYAVGDCVIPLRKAVQSVADAKLLADRLTTALGDTHSDETKDDCWSRSENAFNSRFGKLFPGDLDEFMRFASEPGRTPPSDPSGNYLRDDAVSEAERCLRCDCVSADDCALRQVADEFGAERLHRASRRKDERRKFTRIFDGDIVFEPGKCVKCGRCVAICVKCAEKLGAAFINRGLEMEIAFPPGVSPKEGLGGAAVECAAACPTGAIVILR